jgi:hypothetical protein
MKQILAALLLISTLSCNSSNNSNTTNSDSSTSVKPVQNVNGNIPDTTNGADITGKQKIDTTKIDSSRIKH